jgi:hypothetical protein
MSARVSLLATQAAVLLALLCATACARAATSPPPYWATPLPASGATELQTGVAYPATARLPDGKVLIAGGGDDSLRTAEIFDPSTETFTELPASGDTELGTGRYDAVAAPLPDGDVLIAGGYGLKSAELFSHTSDTFSPLSASLTTIRGGAVAAPLPDGKVLIAGGSSSVSQFQGPDLQSAELFNPTTGTFTALPASGNTELQTPREDAVAAPLPDGKVLIAGGEDGSNTLQSAELFDPTTNTFTALPASGNTELQSPSASAFAVSLPDGNVVIAGGGTPGALFTAAFEQPTELFDPASDTFSTLGPDSDAGVDQAGSAATLLPDGKVLVAGASTDFYSYPTTLPCPPFCTPTSDYQNAELFISAPQAVVDGGAFGDQPLHQPSTAQTVTVTNLGAAALRITSTALSGANAGDFTLLADACSGRSLAFDQACTITTRFTAAAPGARTATLKLTDNEPSPTTIPLTGTGIAPKAPATTKVKVVTCKTVTKTVVKHHRKHKVKRQKCTTKVINRS